MNKLLSIIIPTKNRSYYCLYAVKQIMSLHLHDVEICVQDNSDNDSLKEDFKALDSPDVIYNYHSGVLSFVDNFSEAVSISHGDYLCMIGDDDGILPEIIQYAKRAKDENLDAVIPGLGFVYFWPSKEKIISDVESGLLNLTLCNRDEKYVNPQKAMRRLLDDAAQDYTSLDIPRLYHGIVNRRVLEEVKNKTGVYFGGLTPDMYMAAVLSLECKTVLRTTESFTISGICPTSGSADSATGRHTGNLSDAPHFRGHSSYTWDEKIPAFYSVDTIWAETLLHALKMYDREDLADLFNLPLFESVCLKKYPEFEVLIRKHADKEGIVDTSMITAYRLYYIRKQYYRVIRKIKSIAKYIVSRKSVRSLKINNVPTIVDAGIEILHFVKQGE